MKYLVTESQYELLKEMYIMDGVYPGSYYDDFFSEIKNIKDSKVVKLIRKYFENVVWVKNLDKISKKKILDYVDELSHNYNNLNKFPKIFQNKDVIGNLAYFLAKNLYKVRKGDGLSFTKLILTNDTTTYYFFDDELEQLIGRIIVNSPDVSGVRLPRKSKQVSVSSVDSALKGQGYGKKMYLTLINDVGFLFSDTSLFSESLNIWVNVLPKVLSCGYLDKNDVLVPITRLRHRDMEKTVQRFYCQK